MNINYRIDGNVRSMLTRRAVLLHRNNKAVPSHHEALSNLGGFLGDTVLHEMSPLAKDMMDIETPFPDAPHTMWLSPGDRMNRKVVLKPPPNEEVVKALTHEGILEIGSVVEEKLEQHIRERINAAKKEVEDFERFECKNRIKFAVQQERLAHEAALKQQRQDLLKMFQRDREELIQDSKAELEALTTKLNSEHEVRREMEVQKSVEETQLSANEKINELIERIRILENELSDTDKIISEETEKRKIRNWQILHEMFIEMHRQFTTKLTILHNQHNAEIRQLYLEIKTQVLDSEKSTICNDLWDEISEASGCQREKLEFTDEGRPFLINLGKVDGESTEDEKSPKENDGSSCSSFKCYKHRSKPKGEDEHEEHAVFTSTIRFINSKDENLLETNDINTTDVSCNILRRLGLNFNAANIKKVKVELDDLLLNINKRGETRLLTATDSLELFVSESANKYEENAVLNPSEESVLRKESRYCDREEYRRIMNRKKWKQVNETKTAIPLTVDEYMETLTTVPKYMATDKNNISIWDYRAMTDEEWNALLEELDDRIQSSSDVRSKTVTVTTPNSMESLIGSGIIRSGNSRKPARGILRASVETDKRLLLKNDIFQTDNMQNLVRKLNE